MTRPSEVQYHHSYGSVWASGDMVAGFDSGDGYSIYLCTRAGERGPRGGLGRPAESVSITAPTWGACQRAVQELGFTRPRLTAAQVREGWKP